MPKTLVVRRPQEYGEWELDACVGVRHNLIAPLLVPQLMKLVGEVVDGDVGEWGGIIESSCDGC